MKETLAWMREDNDHNIEKIWNLNEDELEELWEKLHQNYMKEAWKIHDTIPSIDSPEVVEQRENLEDVWWKLQNCTDSAEW